MKSNEQDKKDIESEIKFLISTGRVPKIKEKILAIPDISFRGRFYEKVTMYDNM